MCELFCLSSRFPTTISLSLKTFASHGAPGRIPIDGWGVALYEGPAIRLYKEAEPAGDSACLQFVQGHPLSASIFLSHIRHATTGNISFANTQPFARELGGHDHVFAHNGQLNEITRCTTVTSMRFHPIGATDSEMAFCLLLDSLASLWSGTEVPALLERFDAVVRFAAAMRRLGPANFLYADGDALFAHSDRRMQADGKISAPGLWVLHRECAINLDKLRQSGVKVETINNDQTLILLASVPLSSEDWEPLAQGQVVAINAGRIVASHCDQAPDALCSSKQPDVLVADDVEPVPSGSVNLPHR